MLGVPNRREEGLNERELMNPSVSIVVNTLNRAEALRDLLNALAHQRYDNFEVVVVNGPSTDHTEAVINEFGDLVKARTCALANLSMSRNIGIQATAGEIVAFIDDDGVPEPFWLEELVVPYVDPSVAGVGGVVHDHTGYDYQAKFICCDRLGRASYSLTQPFDDLCAPGTFHYPSLLGCNSSFRRSALVEVGGFDEEYDYYLDETDVCIRLVDAGYRLVQLDGAPVHHKFLPSDVRDQHKVVLNNRPIIKNAVYFSLVNAREHLSMEEILRGLAEFGDARRADLAHNLNVDAISEEQYWPALEVIEQAWAEGFAAGFRGRIALFAELPDKQREGFRPFPTIAQERPLRVVLVSQTLPPETPGGVGRYSLDLAQELAARGHDVRIITSALGDHSTVDLESGAWIHRIVKDCTDPPQPGLPPAPASLQRNIGAVAAEVARLQTIRSIDLVYGPLWDAETLAVSSVAPVPTVTALMTTMGISLKTRTEWSEDPQFMEHFGAPIQALERYMLEHSTALHALSDEILAAVAETSGASVPAWRSIVAHLGVDVENPPNTDRPSTSSDPNPDNFRLLFVGRFEARKGIDLLLDALPAILAEHRNIEVTLIGRDDIPTERGDTYRNRFELLHAQNDWLDRVHFRGEVSDEEVLRAFDDCSVFVAPSRFESFGLIFVEAMRAGKPVIALNKGAAKEVLADSGAGLLVEEQVESLASAIDQLAASPELCATMAASGRSRFQEYFTTAAMTDRLEQLFERIAVWIPTQEDGGQVVLHPARTGQLKRPPVLLPLGRPLQIDLPSRALYSVVMQCSAEQRPTSSEEYEVELINESSAFTLRFVGSGTALETVYCQEPLEGSLTITASCPLRLVAIHQLAIHQLEGLDG